MIALDQLRILVQNLFQLDHRHILTALAAALQTVIVLFDGLVDHIQFVGVLLQPFDILGSDVVFRHDIFTDDPFTQRRYRLAGLKIHQSQQVSRLNI